MDIGTLLAIVLVIAPMAVAIHSWRKLEKRDENHPIALICAAIVFASPFYTDTLGRCNWNGDSRDIMYPVSAVGFIFACLPKMDKKRLATIAFRWAIVLNSVAIWIAYTLIRGYSCLD